MVRGDTNGRWGQVVTISAGPPDWARQVRANWKLSRARGKVGKVIPALASKDGPNLVKLSMIGFARWSIVDRIPAGVPPQQADALRRPFLLFEANFNGDAEAYFEAFAYIVPNPMNRVWDDAYDVPRVERVSEWLGVIRERKERIAYFYSAYPGASTKMIRTALALERKLGDFRPRAANMTSAQFDREFPAFVSEVIGMEDPRAPARNRKTGILTTLIPVDQRRRKQLKESLKALREEGASLPPSTHFARWSIVKRLELPAEFGVDPTSYLLFSAWFDGQRDSYAAALYEHLGPDRARSIWRNCGFRGTSAAAFGSYLAAHDVPLGTAFAGYDGVTVPEVRQALELWDRFAGFARRAQALRGPELLAAWRNDPVLG